MARTDASPSRPLGKAVDLLFRAIELALVMMLVGMLAMVLGNVVLRYAIGTGIYVSEELSRTLFVWIGFVGAVVATRDGTHPRRRVARPAPAAPWQGRLRGR